MKKILFAPGHKERFRLNVVMTLLPLLIWIMAIYARPIVIQTSCADNPGLCSADAVVPSIDRLSLGVESSKADEISYLTQNLSGVLAVSFVTVLEGVRIFTAGISPAVALTSLGADLMLFAQTVFWNGSIGEITRVLTQRPRPYVYANPKDLGKNPANYISFYSGHTSFVAAATTFLFLILLFRSAPWPLVVFTGAMGQTLTVVTALMRVFAGRHFITDVAVAAFVGTLVACLVFRWNIQVTNIQVSRKKPENT